MTAVQQIENLNKIKEGDFENISRILFDSFQIKRKYKSVSLVEKKEELLGHFSAFLEKSLELQIVNTREAKLELINFIDKLNMQKELLELERGETKIVDLKAAGKKLGRKAQSAFETKAK